MQVLLAINATRSIDVGTFPTLLSFRQ